MRLETIRCPEIVYMHLDKLVTLDVFLMSFSPFFPHAHVAGVANSIPIVLYMYS